MGVVKDAEQLIDVYIELICSGNFPSNAASTTATEPSIDGDNLNRETIVFKLNKEGGTRSTSLKSELNASEEIPIIPNDVKVEKSERIVEYSENSGLDLLNAEYEYSDSDTDEALVDDFSTESDSEFETDSDSESYFLTEFSSEEDELSLEITASAKDKSDISKVTKLGDTNENSKAEYSLRVADNYKTYTNVSLSGIYYQIAGLRILCRSLPHKLKENKVISIFEKFGKIYDLILVTNQLNRFAFVTYTSREEAEKALLALDGSECNGKILNVTKFTTTGGIFISPVPSSCTTEQELFNIFAPVTKGLASVYLQEKFAIYGEIAGYCILEYRTQYMAFQAKKILSNKRLFEKRIFCDWNYGNQFDEPPTLFVSNLKHNIRCIHLRKILSVYGEITQIDKDDNFASVVFQNLDDLKRAVREVDKKLLGDENVEIFSTIPPTQEPDTPSRKALGQ